MGGERKINGGLSSRAKLILDINEAFNRRNVRRTAARLGALASTGDALDICEALGFFEDMHGGNFARYKRDLPIPELNRGMLTAAFRLALTAKPQPVPLQILIVSGSHELVTVTCTQTEIVVLLMRDEQRRAPRKRAASAK